MHSQSPSAYGVLPVCCWDRLLVCFVLLYCVSYCRPLTVGVSPDFFQLFFSFPLPFAFRKTTHRVRRGQTSLRNNNGVVLGKLPMERPVWKKRKKEKFGLVSDPSRKHSSGHSCCLVGSPISAPIHSLARQAGTLGLERCFSCFFFLFFVAVPRFVFNIDPQ